MWRVGGEKWEVRLELVGQGCVGEVSSEELTCVAQRAPGEF